MPKNIDGMNVFIELPSTTFPSLSVLHALINSVPAA